MTKLAVSNVFLAASLLIVPFSLPAQTTPAASPEPLSAAAKGLYGLVKSDILKAADKMPEENYAFQPTPDVRTFGQLVGHVADSQYGFCSVVGGEKMAADRVSNEKKTSKADLVQALKDAFAYCDKVYDGMTDAHGAEMVKFFGQQPKLAVLYFNGAHMYEHYGNMVTYMRLKKLVPPSSEK